MHLDEVTFMDSTGLGVLVGAHKAQRARGGVFELVCSEPRLLRLLELTGLDRVFTIHDGSARPVRLSHASPRVTIDSPGGRTR